MRKSWAVVVLAGIASGALIGHVSAQTQPIVPLSPHATGAPAATGPASAPATVETLHDLSTPQNAVMTFLTSLVDDDEAAARSAVTFKDLPDPAAAQVFLDILLSTNQLQKAAHTKFGDTANEPFGDPTGALEMRLAAVKKATPAIENNDAAVTLPGVEGSGQAGTTIMLKKETGVWRLDAVSLFQLKGMPADEVGKRVALAKRILTINKDVAASIDAGKYASAKEAHTDLWDRCMAAAADVSGVSTQPAKAPGK